MATQLKDRDDRITRIEMMMEQNCKDTAESLDIVRLGRSFFRVAGYIGNFIKWAASIFLPLLLLYYAFRDHSK